MELNLLEKTELRITNLKLNNVNLTTVAEIVAQTLGLPADKVLVIDVRENHICLDILEKTVTMQQITGKEAEILTRLQAIDGLELSDEHCLFENLTNPHIEFEAAEPSTVVSMVQHGLGISILPEMVLHSHRHNKQIRIINLDKSYHRLIGLAALSFKKASPAAMAFIACVKSWLMENNLYDF